jgi:uncharacterized membrane protein HdeD (DUF308 family)
LGFSDTIIEIGRKIPDIANSLSDLSEDKNFQQHLGQIGAIGGLCIIGLDIVNKIKKDLQAPEKQAFAAVLKIVFESTKEVLPKSEEIKLKDIKTEDFSKLSFLIFLCYDSVECIIYSSMYSEKSPGWVRTVQIGLGVLTIALSIFALAFPATTFISIIWILAVVLFFVGIEEIIVGIFSPRRSRWSSIGLGILVLIFAGIAMTFPVAAAITIIIFIGIAFLINGIARIIEGFSGKHSGISRAFLIGVGILAIALSVAVLASPFFGARLAGIIIGIGLLITGIQMIYAGIQGRRMQTTSGHITR